MMFLIGVGVLLVLAILAGMWLTAENLREDEE